MTIIKKFISHPHFKKITVALFLSISLIIFIFFRIYDHYHIDTEDAYINANIVKIASQVSGKIIDLKVKDNQYVKINDVLFLIDPQPFQLAVNSARAELMVTQTEYDNALKTEQRIQTLVNKHVLSQQDGDNAIAHTHISLAKMNEAKAHLDQANLNLSYTVIRAPMSGWISNLSSRIGDMSLANVPLFALISDENFWVDANLKETELGRVRIGQSADITTDLYPHFLFHGRVESISSAAGTVFSLLPAQNATGNWIKITQRIPVKIHILNPNPAYPLRIGASAYVTINL